MSFRLLWSDERYLAVFKPAGISVFPFRKDPARGCVHDLLLAAHPEQAEIAWPPGFEGGIAHRLDVSTSGQLLVARSATALESLRRQFIDHRLDKRYLLLTSRAVAWTHHEVSRRIAHDRRNRKRMVVERGRSTPHRGRWLEAETRFRLRGSVDDGVWAWEAQMQTGVMHQIRLHAACVGIALCGDRLYGGGPAACPRPAGVDFFLHHIGLTGPDLCPTPADLPRWWPRVRSD